MVSIPTIQSLDLIAQPSIILHRRFPALKHLTTRFLSRSSPGRFRKSIDSPAGDGAAFGNPTILETLNIQSSGSGGNTWDAFDYLASESNTNIFLYSLKDLSFLCSHNLSWEGARKILDKCRGSLQTLTFKCHRLPGLGPHPNLEFFALPNLHRLTVMLPLKKYGASGSPISWLSSEIFSGAPFSTGKLENVVILIVLGLDQELEDYEAQDLARISETLANEDKFPYLRSVELVLCTWTGSFPPAEGMIRQKSRARPYVGSVEVLEAFRGVTDELARRGLDIFELRWEYHDTSPWDWY
ncbi:hypothetical protein BKA70DRAFT_1290861 [Coprinopsis sp. MPI-PUGE-AT-0042]|nr:hypothetical protein BKA70DRAFT_1290861 [Coprinopsis sp. MPI-PUGE-AT-0042]